MNGIPPPKPPQIATPSRSRGVAYLGAPRSRGTCRSRPGPLYGGWRPRSRRSCGASRKQERTHSTPYSVHRCAGGAKIYTARPGQESGDIDGHGTGFRVACLPFVLRHRRTNGIPQPKSPRIAPPRRLRGAGAHLGATSCATSTSRPEAKGWMSELRRCRQAERRQDIELDGIEI